MDEGHGNVGPSTAPPQSGPPSIDKPKVDLSWQDCTREVLANANITTSPTFTLECAEYKAPLDPINGAPGSVTLGAVRAKTSQTPADAGPLVFTTGSDLPSSVQLATWLNGPGAEVLKQRPVVAVDRRGIGRSDAITCRDTWDTRDMRDQAQNRAGDDPVASLGKIVETATTNCTDTISPEIPRTTTPMPPRTLRRYAPNGTCPPWRSWVSAAAPGSPWPMPDRTPTRWRGSCSTRRWPPTSRRRPPPNSGSRVSSPHSTRSPRSASPTTARSDPIRPGPSVTC